MVTSFTSRELVRDELVALFTSNNSWQEVYGYFPSVNEVANKTPFLVITSSGTIQSFGGMETNKVSYRFTLSSWVLAYSASDNWTSANAEDKLDDLDKVLRQVIRNNMGSLTYANLLRFDGGSEVRRVEFENMPYLLEARTLIADVIRGAI